MVPSWWRAWVEDARADLTRKNSAYVSKYGLSLNGSWRWDLDSVRMRFVEGGKVVASVPLQVVGTLADGYWLWSWANETFPYPTKRQLTRVRDFGVEHELTPLTQPSWHATDRDAEDMAAVATRILDASGFF